MPLELATKTAHIRATTIGWQIMAECNRMKVGLENAETLLKAMRVRIIALERENRMLKDQWSLCQTLKRNVARILQPKPARLSNAKN